MQATVTKFKDNYNHQNINESSPSHLSFFNTSQSKFGRACFANAAKEIVNKWDFDWLNLSLPTFKSRLNFELENIMML